MRDVEDAMLLKAKALIHISEHYMRSTFYRELSNCAWYAKEREDAEREDWIEQMEE